MVLGLDKSVESEESDAAFADQVVRKLGELDEFSGRRFAEMF